MDLSNIDLLALQTAYMQQDPTTKAMCAAITPQLQGVADKVATCLILQRVDELDEDVLDELAWELHIDWYDATAQIDVKRKLIKNSDAVHSYAGTPYAVEQVLNDYYDDAMIQEWFEYGYDQGYFRIITSNPDIDVNGSKYQQFMKILECVKRKSAWLHEIVMKATIQAEQYIGIATSEFEHVTLEVS